MEAEFAASSRLAVPLGAVAQSGSRFVFLWCDDPLADRAPAARLVQRALFCPSKVRNAPSGNSGAGTAGFIAWVMWRVALRNCGSSGGTALRIDP